MACSAPKLLRKGDSNVTILTKLLKRYNDHDSPQWIVSRELAFHSSIMEQSNMVSTVFRVTDLKSQMQFVGFLNLDFQASLYE